MTIEVSMNTQQCNKCNEIKAIDKFGVTKVPKVTLNYKNKQAAIRKTCLACEAERAREFRKKHKNYRGSGKLKSIPDEHKFLMSTIRAKVQHAKQNIKRLNRPFDIDADYIYDLWKQQNNQCVYTGEQFKIVKGHPANLSIDKIVPELGYVKGNIQLVCWAINRAKGDLTHETFIKMCTAVSKRATTSESTQ